jgi:hypothetical protein
MQLTSSKGFPKNIRIQAIIIAELKLGHIERQVLATHFVIGSDDAALNQAPKTFNRVCVNCANDILPCRVIDAPVVVFSQRVVGAAIIGRQQADFVGNHFANEVLHSRPSKTINCASNHVAVALNGADHCELVERAELSVMRAMFVVLLAADVRFINLHDAHELAEILVRQSDAHAVAHVPSGFVTAEAHRAVDLQGANAFLARQYHVNNAEPVAKRLVCVFKDSSGNMAETVALAVFCTGVALPLELHRTGLRNLVRAAARAPDAYRPAVTDQVLGARRFGRKRRFPLWDGHLVNALGGLSHGRSLSTTRGI